MRLRTKILILGTSGILLTGLTVVTAVLYQESQLDEQFRAEADVRTRCECSKIAQDVYLMLRVHEEGVERRVRTNLNVAHAFIEQAGGVSLAKDTVAWEAINQLTRQGRQAVLPKMLLGGAWLGQNRDGGKPSSLVRPTPIAAGRELHDLPANGPERRHAGRLDQRPAGRRLPRRRRLHPRHGSRWNGQPRHQSRSSRRDVRRQGLCRQCLVHGRL